MLDDEITEYDFINTAFNSKDVADSNNQSRICFELQSNHSEGGGAPEVTEFELLEVSYDRIGKEGTVEISYEVYFYWGCSDMNNSQDFKLQCSFSIDVASLTLGLYIPDAVIRDTFEEF